MSISHLFALLKPAATVRIHCRGKRGAVLSLKTTFSSRLFLCWATRIRSVGGGVAELSASCEIAIVAIATTITNQMASTQTSLVATI